MSNKFNIGDCVIPVEYPTRKGIIVELSTYPEVAYSIHFLNNAPGLKRAWWTDSELLMHKQFNWETAND